MKNRRLLIAPFAVLLLALPLSSQQPAPAGCQAPATLAPIRGVNLFSEERENDLGDALAEQFQREFRVVEDEEVTGYLKRIGERIVKNLPPTNLRYRFFVSDLPIVQAFTLPGARIYVTRKLIAFARSEDELAGVIAHEIGHVITRQPAFHFSEAFRKVLGTTQVGDRNDVFEKYHQLLDNIARKPDAFGSSRGEAEREQIIADQVSFYAGAQAGYDPKAFAAFFDRLAETEGKTGNWLSNFLGATKPEQRRLREMLKTLPKIPENCIDRRAAANPEEFQTWQNSVVTYSGSGRRESLHGVLARRVLEPPIRTDVGHMRFSPDGKYILAQDDSSIFVASREPLAFLFRIDAEEAQPAQFSPDSQYIIFRSIGMRVETWNIAEEKRASVHEVYKRNGCIQAALSPDGKTLACYEDRSFDVSLTDVATGTTVFEKKQFFLPNILAYLLIRIAQIAGEGEAMFLHMDFSPDGRYFVAGLDGTVLAYDFQVQKTISLPGKIKNLVSRQFAFVGPDRIVGVDGVKGDKSGVVRFPTGEVITPLTLGTQRLAGVARGDYVLLRPIKDYAVGAMDLRNQKIVFANKRAAFDVFDETAVSERINGEISLYRMADNKRLASLTLPRSPLGRLRAAEVSADLTWLAISERNRGAVWNLRTGERVFYLRGFRGAEFAGSTLLADFPKYEDTPRNIAILDLRSRDTSYGEKLEDRSVAQHGRFLIERKPAKKDGGLAKNIVVDVRDVHTNNLLWSRPFAQEAPAILVSAQEGAIGFLWYTQTDAAKAAAKEDPALKERLAAMKEKQGDYYLLVLDARTGQVRGKLLVETSKGSFRISDVTVAGDWAAVEDTGNRVLVYSLATGEQKGHFFGNRVTLSNAAHLMCFENEPGQLSFYDLDSMTKRGEVSFSSRVSYLSFSDDGKKFFVLTRNQSTYVLDVAAVLAGGAPRPAGP